MTIRQFDLSQIGDLLLRSLLPLCLAFLFPSFTQKHQIRIISKALVIQTSKMDPPRIAFDQINQTKKSPTNEWKTLETEKSISLKSGTQNLSSVSVKDIFRTKRINLPTMVFTENDVSQFVQEQRWKQQLTPSEAQRVSIANEKDGILDENWDIPSLQVATQRSIAQAVQESPELAEKIKKTEATVKVVSNLVQGELELRGGLPSGPHWQIEIARYQDDVKKEDAKVDNKKSTFQIQVAELSGRLDAKLRDNRTGEIIGEGSYRLSSATDFQNKSPKIVISKTNNSIAANYHSINSDPYNLTRQGEVTRKNISASVLLASINNESRTDDSGNYRFDQVQKGSIALVRTEAENFYPALFSLRSGEEKGQTLFPTKMISAMKEIIKEQNLTSEYRETGSIVWGQIKKSGKPYAGAEVTVEDLPAYKVVYLNSFFIPDAKLKATSENGYFVILDLPEGYHSLLAKTGPLYLSHVNTVTDEETISVAELEINDIKNRTDIKVFDAFTGNPAIANLELQSLPEGLDVNGYAEVSLPEVSRLSFLNVTPDNPAYLKTMMNYNDIDDFIHVPLISAAWVQSMMTGQKINIIPDRGLVVGFSESASYDIYLGYDSKFPRENIVYFDAKGSLTDKATVGGGFVIFNVPLGPQSVVLAEQSSDMLHMQMIDVNTEATSVVKF